MIKPIDLQMRTIRETLSEGVYSLDPLPKGYGHTIGNVLRRVLLTSVEGSAITQVSIKGVEHQFSTIKGVKEDVVAITLNLKNLRFKKFTKDPVVLTLSANKKGLITGGDFECPSDVEVVNKDSPVATLTKSGIALEMEVVVESGYGFSPSEDRETSKIGVILMDALFTPVLEVSYEVDPTRFGKSVDLDKVTLSVRTDGSISPSEAIIESSRLIKAFFERMVIWDAIEGVTEEILETVSASASLGDGTVLVEELPLPTRTLNALKKANIMNMQELAEKTEEELLDIKNLGQKSIEEINKLLNRETSK